MDMNSLSHTKWECKYHIVFAPKFRRKVAYGQIKQDIANILSILCKRKGSGNHRSRGVPRSHPYAGKDTTEHECIKFRRILKGEEHLNDIREACELKVQVRQ